ncbi:MAG: 2OG-Fe dioxygenase family protein, partial [Caldimonas sp.]
MSDAAIAIATTPVADLATAVAERGHAVLSPADFVRFVATSVAALDALRPSWDTLPPDIHQRDGGRYRRR